MSGYWPTCARRTASVLISSMVRSDFSCEKQGKLSEKLTRKRSATDTANEMGNDFIERAWWCCSRVDTGFDSFPIEKNTGPVGEPAPVQGRYTYLKNKLQTKLYGATAARTDHRVGSSDVGSGASTPEARRGRIVEAETILAAIWIGKIRMIENVEELRAELSAEALAEMEVLRHREIHVAETRIRENVASHGAEGPQCWGNHDGVSFGVAAVYGQ